MVLASKKLINLSFLFFFYLRHRETCEECREGKCEEFREGKCEEFREGK
jgi:hypothetical protein